MRIWKELTRSVTFYFDTAAFYDVPMFDASSNLNVHIMSSEDDSLIVRHFVFH